MRNAPAILPAVDETAAAFRHALQKSVALPAPASVGTVDYVGRGIARVRGLPGVLPGEILRFDGGAYGTAFNLEEEETGVMLLGGGQLPGAGSEAVRTGRTLDVPVGEALLGRVVDALGRPLDDRGRIESSERRPIERPAPALMDRAPVTEPLQTGIKVIDALIPIGRGQRELILGDRSTGKTAIALDTIINQRGTDVICIYCAIGQRSSSVAKFVDDIGRFGVRERCIAVVAPGEEMPGLQFAAPYAATAMGEYFMDRGRDVLVVYDDLTAHARTYRELALLFRRPPAREAYPGDIFYIHSRLLERATHLSGARGGGSMTALPIAETEAQNIAAYIPTNLISITDGQIYLSPVLFERGQLPAVDVGTSVSRVGGKAQRLAYHAVAADLRLSYAQFEELEVFSRFGTRLDERTKRVIGHGRRVREVFKQPQYEPLPVGEQIAALLAATAGLFDNVPTGRTGEAERRVADTVRERLPDTFRRIERGERLGPEERASIIDAMRRGLAGFAAPGRASHADA